jgi:hypothetical protein
MFLIPQKAKLSFETKQLRSFYLAISRTTNKNGRCWFF